MPETYDPLAKVQDIAMVSKRLGQMPKDVFETVSALPTHNEFIERFCKADALAR